MGCGSSKIRNDRVSGEQASGEQASGKQTSDEQASGEQAAAVAQVTLAFSSHISTILGLPPIHPEIQQYVSALNSEGYNTPDDFDELTVDELREEPFCFKAGHLKRVSRSRTKSDAATAAAAAAALPPPGPADRNSQTNIRGQCSLCGLDVLDTQPRIRHPETGVYQHQDCQARGAGSLAAPNTASRTSRTGVPVSEQAIAQAKRKAAAATEEAEAEVAAIMAAAGAAQASVIAAKGRAEESLAAAQNEAVLQSAAAAQSQPQAPVQTIDHETASAASGSTRSLTSAAPASTAFLPAAPKTKPLLPNGKHAFLSYQWDVQGQVKEIKSLLNERHIKCWMDIDGGMKSDIYDSMAEGVQGAACVVCFMTQPYQDSANCKLELKFAQQSGVPIIPVMMQANFAAKGWLAILTAGSIWTPMYEKAQVLDGVGKLIEQAQHLVPGMRGADDASDAASEAGDITEPFDVAAWGDAMFSLDDMREELERLRDGTAPSNSFARKGANEASDGVMCNLPAMVPTLPRGLFVTEAMHRVLDAVVSDTSEPQIGFCGMGGIGKTTVSCWVTRDDAVRTKFGMVAWITLGQTPVLDSCIDLLHQQLTGSPLPDGISADQKHEFLQEAFRNQSVLLVLDDCWDADVVTPFNWIDQKTNSKILISSRVRDVLDGGDIIDVAVPSKDDAVKMLLSTAGIDINVLHGSAEIARIADLCKRLPLTIGVAGKLIRQLSHGSSMTEASDWAEVTALLEDEMNDPGGSWSVEESVIRASIKAIPAKIRPHVTQLFIGFALAPEDTLVPLPVLGMIFDACGAELAKPLSRLQVRRYLKVLIDRSLVLGTVDRPQLHDVMLEYVQHELAGSVYKDAQRRLVEFLRNSDRSEATETGQYTKRNVRHHIKEAHDATWEQSKQATSWLEDHIGGVQDVVAISTAFTLPVEAMAKEAEATGMWWQAALRWNAFGGMKMEEAGSVTGGLEYAKKAINASAKVKVDLNSTNDTVDASTTQFNLDTFDLKGLGNIFQSWDPDVIKVYGERYLNVLATEAGRSQPLLAYRATFSLVCFPACVSGNEQDFSNSCWKLSKMIIDLCNAKLDGYALATEEDRATAKPLLGWTLVLAGDAIVNDPGFSWDYCGPNGDFLIEHDNAYVHGVHSTQFTDIISYDPFAAPGAPFIVTLEYGRIADARKMIDRNLVIAELQLRDVASAGIQITTLQLTALAPELFHIHGLSQHVRKLMGYAGLTFENACEELVKRNASMIGTLIAPLEHTGPGGGMFSQKRMVWHIKVLCILHLDVPKSEAKAWLESLPDNDAFYATTMTFPTHVHLYPLYRTCWIALAHEKHGLHDGALRFADLQLETDMLKAGTPLVKWPQVIALACKGRVLAKLGRHDEALAAFQAGIATSKGSYSLMEAFAYRELANYADGGDASVRAKEDLEAKLDTFKGRMSRAEFDELTIGPG